QWFQKSAMEYGKARKSLKSSRPPRFPRSSRLPSRKPRMLGAEKLYFVRWRTVLEGGSIQVQIDQYHCDLVSLLSILAKGPFVLPTILELHTQWLNQEIM